MFKYGLILLFNAMFLEVLWWKTLASGWEILRFWHSGINISGTYPIPITLIERLEAILLKYSKPEVEEPDLITWLGGGKDGQ